MQREIEKRPVGGLDMTTNYQDVNPVDYVDAKNLTNNERDINSAVDLKGIKGIEKVVGELSLPAGEYKTVRVLVSRLNDPAILNPGNICSVVLKNGAGVPFTVPYVISNPTVSTITDLRNEVDTYLNSSIPITVAGLVATVSSVVFTTSSNIYVGYFDIGFNNIPDDWSLEFQPLAPNNIKYDVQILTECISNYVYTKGKAELIGSCRTENDTFLFWTTVNKIEDIPVASPFLSNNVTAWTNLLNPGVASNVRITFSQPHGLASGDIIKLYGSAPGALGQYDSLWSINVFNNFNIDLCWSAANTFVAYPPTGIWVDNHVHGYGCITVATRDKDQDTQFTDTKLLVRAKGLNFSKFHQIDARVKKNNLQTCIKFTDNNNQPKMLIYEGEYNTNGFIYGFNGYDFPIQGLYFYENISSTSRMLIGDNSLKISVIENTTGGQLKAKNYVYYVRGVFQDFTKTTFSRPTNPISVISSDFLNDSISYEYTGSEYNAITTKQNTITIENIPIKTYSYIELAAIEYGPNGSFSGYVVKRQEIGNSETTLSISHTGSEIYEDLDLATINQLYLSITKALNIEELDNRGVLSNVEVQIDADLNAIAQNIEYGIFRYPIRPVIDIALTNGDGYGEYRDPNNGNRYTGYMLFETIRWGLRVKWKNSNWSNVYWIGDFRVDDSPIGGRKFSTIPNYTLRTGIDTYVFYFQFRNFDLDALVGGQRLRDLIDDYEYVRAPIAKEILAVGTAYLSVDCSAVNPATLGLRFISTLAVDPSSGGGPGVLDRTKIFFFPPDFLYKDAPTLEWKANDEIITIGAPSYLNSPSGAAPFGNWTQGTLGEAYEQTPNNGATSATIQTIAVNSVTKLFFQNTAVNGFYAYDGLDAPAYPINQNHPIPTTYGLELAGPINNVGVNFDLGSYTIFYRRPLTQLYPLDPTQSTYYSVGFTNSDVQNDIFLTVKAVWGGDSMIQKTYLFLRNYDTTPIPATNPIIRTGIYSINRTNTQQQVGTYPGFNPNSPSPSYAASRTALFSPNYTNYNTQYSTAFNPINITSQYTPFDENAFQNGKQEATIYWSELGFVDSKFNYDRYFLYANQRALDLSYGPIKDMKSINDILITLQPKKTERQYFDNTGKLVSDTTDILIGTGAVMGRKGDFLSAYGCSNKWGSFVGRSTGGKEVLYYIDSINKAIIRVGADGTVVLSDRNNMSNYLYEHVRLAEFFDRPVYDYGISGIWDQKNRWAIFSVKAHLPTYTPAPTQWESGVGYTDGDVVYDEYGYYYYDGLPALYVCIIPHVSSVVDEPARMSPASKEYWQLIPVTDTRYYNYFTLVFSETENKFKWFMSPVCNHYASYYDSYIVTNPRKLTYQNGNVNTLYYLDESGERCEWFKYNYDFRDRSPSGLPFVYSVSGTFVAGFSLYQLIPVYELSKNIQIYFIGPDDGVEYEVIDYYSTDGGTFMILNTEYPFPSAVYFELNIKISLKEDAYFTMVINETRGQLVKYGAIRYDAELPVYRADFNTSQPLQSYLTQADFESIDTYEYSPIKNDTTAGNSPDDDTSFLYGKYCLIKTTIRAKTEQIIHKFVTRVRALNRIIPR